ncbi:hypothetical protein IT157_04245 [bacterium]|nr:hypothetical protein [bacterium]
MIRLTIQDEPGAFDSKVRKKGETYLQKNGIDLYKPLPSGTKLPPYWCDCLEELYESYGGMCAYLAVYFELETGAGTVEHFFPKSLMPQFAYEWENYRLVTRIVNSRKRDYLDVLDPADIENDWFLLNLLSGKPYPNPQLDCDIMGKVSVTINRLGLDKPRVNAMRALHYQKYVSGKWSAEELHESSPFVWNEASRQGLL